MAKSLGNKLIWLAPAVGLLAILSFYPLIFSVKVSLTGARGAFTLAHYARLLTDQLFHAAVIQTGLYAAVSLIAETILGLALALLIDSLHRGRAFFRAGLLAPLLLPPVVCAVVWRLIFNPQFGVLNGTLRSWGIDTSNLTWTNGSNTALLSVAAVDIWQWTPFMFLLLSAGLQAVPRDPIEAAKIDGASPWRVFVDIVFPLLKPTLLLAVILRAMDLIRIFDQIWILTQGGPGSATETVSLYIYKTAFRFFNFGYAAAMSFLGLLLTTIFARTLIKLAAVKGRA